MAEALIRETLEEYGALARAAMAPYLVGGAPAEHLYDPVADYPGRGGKMMRPAICIAAARAFGAAPEDAARTAAGIELIHNALLIHDDIEDESDMRRGRPTLHELHGLPIALNAGDALAMLSLRPLIDNIPDIGPWLSLRIIEEMERMAKESVEGQAIELGWRKDNSVNLAPEDYLVMVLKKTCWLAAIYPCRVGALLGLRREIEPDAFVRFGFFLGAAFQIHDDVLNIEADDRYGKEICGDLLEGKRTLMLIDMLARLEEGERARLVAALGARREDIDEAEVIWMRDRMIETGCLDRARRIARGLAGAAQHEFELAFRDLPASRDAAFLRALAPWTLSRAA